MDHPDHDALTDLARLEALHATKLLDTLPDEAFDRFTRLASQSLGVPVSLVSLIDADRQWMKSSIGLPEPFAASQEVSLEQSFCSVVVRRDAPFVTHDIEQDEARFEFPTLVGLGVRAYAGMPLRTEDGHTLGSLCAIDVEPRRWTKAELATLEDIAAIVMSEIDLRHALQLSEHRREEIEVSASSIRTLHGVLDSADAGHIEATDEALRVAADLAHELRTPLYAIRMLTEDLTAAAPEPLKEDLERVDQATTEALGVINHQLDLARANAGSTKLRIGPTQVEGLFRALRGMLEPLPRAEGVRLVVEDGDDLPTLDTDELKLAQILRNLTTNALRHTERGEVRVSAAPDRDGKCITFTVADTGIGIAPEDQERIFRRFEQAPGARAGGTGLGLPLARRMARMIGGTITLDSEVGRGSTFTLTVPVDVDRPPFRND